MDDVNAEDEPDVPQAIDRPRRAGWSVGDSAFSTEGGPLVRVVSGSSGKDLIWAEGSTADDWHRAVEQARELGMLGRCSS